jgi:hypothetical protein
MLMRKKNFISLHLHLPPPLLPIKSTEYLRIEIIYGIFVFILPTLALLIFIYTQHNECHETGRV